MTFLVESVRIEALSHVASSLTERDPVVDSAARGDVAQLGEHRVRIAGVRGSSPLISTTVGRLGRW